VRGHTFQPGQRFGRLTVVGYDRYQGERSFWHMVCDCGNKRSVGAPSLVSGATKSCGCLRIERSRAAVVTHGMTNTRAYKAWKNMISRCYHSSTKAWHRYGGRGIKVCDRWRHSFEAFLADMGEPPPRMSLDRFPDNDGNYEPGNCRWTNQKTQSRNTCKATVVEFAGERVPLADLCERMGIRKPMVQARLHRGWSVERAITTPSLK
jgi:hypothetical protein